MKKRRFELVEGKSRKFWEISRAGSEVRTYGKIGTAGQTTVKDEGSDDAATKLFDKLIREKAKKGYVEVATSPAAPSTGSFDLFARLAELAAVDAVDEDGDELLGLADLEILATASQRDAISLRDLGIEAPRGAVTPPVLHGSGSLVAGWQADASAPMRAVWIDSEGEPRAVFAGSMEEMFRLLPHGLGYLYDCVRSAERGATLARGTGCDVEAWTEAGFAPHPAPGAAVSSAYRASPRFSDWLAGLSGGATSDPETSP